MWRLPHSHPILLTHAIQRLQHLLTHNPAAQGRSGVDSGAAGAGMHPPPALPCLTAAAPPPRPSSPQPSPPPTWHRPQLQQAGGAEQGARGSARAKTAGWACFPQAQAPGLAAGALARHKGGGGPRLTHHSAALPRGLDRRGPRRCSHSHPAPAAGHLQAGGAGSTRGDSAAASHFAWAAKLAGTPPLSSL